MCAENVSMGYGISYLMDGGAVTAQNEHTPEFLKELQAMPMEAKVYLTQARLAEFYTGYNTIGYGNAYISFSGGKDSTVLLDIARKIYPEIPAVFSNTGLEYPEIRRFAKAHDNVEVVQPKMAFNEVISKYGYPLIGKEVAEAIYYARRIVPAEREREKWQRSGRNSQAHDSEADGTHRHTTAKRTELTGTRQRSGQTGVNGIPMNREREPDGFSAGSEVPPG